MSVGRSSAPVVERRLATPDAPNAPVLDPTTQRFLDGLAERGVPPLDTLTPAAARARLAGLQSGPVARPPASIQDTTFPVGPTGAVRVRIVRPRSAVGVLPAIVHLHGGGWVAGDRDTHDRLARELAVGAGAAVVLVDHDRAPEARFPMAIEQAYAALAYVAEDGAPLGLDPTRIALAGDGTGGAIAAAVTRIVQSRGGPKLRFQVLFHPVTDAGCDTMSYRELADGPWLTRAAMRWAWDHWLPDVEARKQPLASPLRASISDLRGLPEALVIVGEHDVLRDEGEAYARKLAQAGVRVTSTRYNGAIHDFVVLDALAGTPAARGAIRQASDALRAALA